jgi:hypothetical protein
VHSSGDIEACVVSGCELAWLLMYTLLVTQTVACLFSEGKLACFLMCALCALLVMKIVTCLVSGCEWLSF